MTMRSTVSLVSAADMARDRGIDPKRFRAALRAADLAWHRHNDGWTVLRDSREHQELVRVLASLVDGAPIARRATANRATSRIAGVYPTTSSDRDEAWVIGLCDAVLGRMAIRQHRFQFLLGDPGPSGRRASLPVDAWYPELGLVVEYHERQHTEQVAFFDRRLTVSGMSRGEQRSRYDELRRKVLPANGLRLEILEFREFKHDRAGRLLRRDSDRTVVWRRLSNYRAEYPTDLHTWRDEATGEMKWSVPVKGPAH